MRGLPISGSSLAALAVWVLSTTVPVAAQAGADPPQTQTDAYTRYELQAPGSESFRIIYDVTATTAGAVYYYNGIRAGAEETVHSVTDLHTGAPLAWEVVDGRYARANGHPRANEDGHFIKVTLARPVPEGGQGRIRIDKTYRDANSYFTEDGDVVFSRTLGIRRNSVVLPAGYELVGCNHECQVDTEAEDGGPARIRVSFMNPGPSGVPFLVRGRPLPVRAGSRRTSAAGRTAAEGGVSTTQTVNSAARVGRTFPERAFQDRDITYYLQQPETHSFRLFHDYTESRPGVDRYLNIVRAGSKASDPEATILDTGESLVIETLKWTEIAERGVDIGQQPTPESEVVVIWFDAVQEGQSVRLRIWETYTDPGRYVLNGDELVWDRSFGRARNTVILPEGWYLTTNAIPGVIDQDELGRTRVRYTNGRPDQIQTFIKARRR